MHNNWCMGVVSASHLPLLYKFEPSGHRESLTQIFLLICDTIKVRCERGSWENMCLSEMGVNTITQMESLSSWRCFPWLGLARMQVITCVSFNFLKEHIWLCQKKKILKNIRMCISSKGGPRKFNLENSEGRDKRKRTH